MSSSKEGDKDAARKAKNAKRPELNNGGSLEDCISNVYSLLELPGIKWKCFRTKPNAQRGVPLTTDPVLKAYSKCVLDGVLCTWRRKQLTATGNNELLPLPHFSNDTPKELWVFWYDEEPPVIQQHCEGLEHDEEMSSESQGNIVSYEVRTILFKALHVVLERDFTKEGFVRFGRWFTVPFDARENYLHYMYPTYSPAIRLNFFVHGGNTICASVQAQRQPTLLMLAKRHLEYKSTKRFAVIVGPWSMRGILVQDQLPLLADPKMQETAEAEWNHWKEYLQMEQKEPETVPDTERAKSPEPEPTPAPHRSLLTDSSDEESSQHFDQTDEQPSKNDEGLPRLKWLLEPDLKTEKAKDETPEEKEKREKEREIRRKRRKEREERRKEIEKQRTEVTNPEDYDSEVVTDAEPDDPETPVNNDVPRMVLLEIDGVRMLYPSKFICVTLEDDRHVLDSMGYRTNTVPEELQVQGRRPRNKFVVGVSNPILSTLAVYKYCQFENRYAHDSERLVDRSGLNGNTYGQQLPAIKEKHIRWKFTSRNWQCDDGLYGFCTMCDFFQSKGKENGNMAIQHKDSEEMYATMVNRVRRKNKFCAYHKKKTQPSRDRRGRKAVLKNTTSIKGKPVVITLSDGETSEPEKTKKVEKEEATGPVSVFRVNSEDEAFQVDKMSQQDWANFEDEHPKGIPQIDVPKEVEFYNEVTLEKPAHDENYKPTPFLPMSFINKNPENSDFEYKHGDEEMSDDRFHELYKDKRNKWRPGMSRSERIECADYQFDPWNHRSSSPRPYHLKEMPRRNKWEPSLPAPKQNKYFKGAVCKRGLRGLDEVWAEADRRRDEKKTAYLERARKSRSLHHAKVARMCQRKMNSYLARRSIDRAVRQLRKIARRDKRSEGTKLQKMKKIKEKRQNGQKSVEESAKKAVSLEDALDKLDVNSFSTKFEMCGPHGEGQSMGFIAPLDRSSPLHSATDDTSDSEVDDPRHGLGEGTSVQYPDGDAIEPTVAVSAPPAVITDARTAGEHVGPDGLLSPPASNEMPKGGPLSVGPPSIESQGLNQIYPTPPSVQMLQADHQQHSPKMKSSSAHAMHDDDVMVERIAVPGGGGSIVEIEADDEETRNMRNWNRKADAKVSKFLAFSCNDPILSAKKRKFTTPVTDAFKVEDVTEKASAGLVYKKMLTRNFECAPHHSFAELVRAKIHEKRQAALAAPPPPPAPTTSTTLPPSHHQPGVSPMIPPSPSFVPYPTTPTYQPQRPGGVYPQMGGHMMMGSPMGQPMGGPPMGPPMGQQRPPPYMGQMQQMQQMQRMQQMMRPMPPPPAGPPPPQQPPLYHPPAGNYVMGHTGQSSVQQLNNFVNQSRFGPAPYMMQQQQQQMQQPYSGMSPMQQYQMQQMQHMQQQRQQPMPGMMPPQMPPQQLQQHHQQQQQQQHQQQQIVPAVPAVNPAQQSAIQQQQQLHAALLNMTDKQKRKFQIRQHQIVRGLMPTSLQPLVLRSMKNQPDANVPINKQLMVSFRPPETQVPEGDSLTIAIILSDTILDLHFDSVFDSCPICACSVSIRSRDLGMYITPHELLRTAQPGHSNMREHTTGTWSGFHVNSATNCTCGFSAIRHRYLSCCSGLFAEDANEATTLDNAVATVVPPLDYPKKSTARDMTWFDSKSVHDMALLDQIRQMSFSNSLGKAISQMATVREHKRDLASAMEIDMDISVPSEYVISHVDSMELLMLGNSAIDMSMKSSSSCRNQTVSAQKFLTYFHPWGLQTANEISELEAAEWVDLLSTVTPTLEAALRKTKVTPAVVAPESSPAPLAIEGPMTWRQLVAKSMKGRPVADEEEDFSLAEPIPAVMRATEKEAIRSAPHIDQYSDLANLGPVDQPKDVMYITIIPDDDVVYSKTVKFMDELTKTYERMRLGRHIPFPVSTGTATRFREVYKACQQQFAFPEQQPQLVGYVNQTMRNTPQTLAEPQPPVTTEPEKWAERARKKIQVHEALRKGVERDDTEHIPFTDKRKMFWLGGSAPAPPASFYEREGILRVGTPMEPTRIPWNHTVTNTPEFANMTKHLNDATGFISKLKLYLQQMEDLVSYALSENAEAFERKGYRYQLAVEGRLKRDTLKRAKLEENMRFNAAKAEDEKRTEHSKKPEEGEVPSGVEVGNAVTEEWVDDDLEEKKRRKQKEDEQYPVEQPQAPSPVPAGMVHIPETLSQHEQSTQPTLAELFADPASVLPHNAPNISWKQRDTSVPNPFPSSNQPPVPFEVIGNSDTDAYSTLPHVIVIYMVNPFTYGVEGHSAIHMRIAILAFIRAFNSIMGRLPYQKRPQLQLEIVGLESMDEVCKPVPDYFNDPKIPFDILHGRPTRLEKPSESAHSQLTRSLSVAVYTHPRVFFPDVYKSVSARCMTAFGPGSQLINTINEIEKMNNDAFVRMAKRSKNALNSMDGYRHMMPPMPHVEKKNYVAYRVPSTIICLAPPPVAVQMEENGKTTLSPVDEQTLFVSYCLVGTDFLVATATDAQGRLIDNCIANIKPRRQSNQLYRYKNKTQILDGMGKLWSFILGIMASEIKNWRLVVGRLGRIGHGEFRAWTHLLNKTSLLRYSGSLKDICTACRSMPSNIGTPAILSACLITLEPEPSIRVMPEFYDQETSAKKNSLFQTPGDLSCTHILTFPVGAEINLEVQDQTADTKADENWEFGDFDIMDGLDDGDTEIMKDLGLEAPTSAAIRQSGGTSMFFSEDSSTIEIQNQPLASGYYISTAPAPELPNWFWATCPSSKRHNPVHLKSSLHINISEVKNDDIAMESTKEKDTDKDKEEKDKHPLESRQTEEVLRHVLESYNALSWLNLNRQTGERYSCLPIHVQHLLRLYHSVARLLA